MAAARIVLEALSGRQESRQNCDLIMKQFSKFSHSKCDILRCNCIFFFWLEVGGALPALCALRTTYNKLSPVLQNSEHTGSWHRWHCTHPVKDLWES